MINREEINIIIIIGLVLALVFSMLPNSKIEWINKNILESSSILKQRE